jgi:hypothetical protein
MKLPGKYLRAITASRAGEWHAGHAHFWERVLSRRQLVGSGAVAGAVLGAGLLVPKLALAKGTADPRPIAGGLQALKLFGVPDPTLFHFFLPQLGLGLDPSAITDFRGFAGLSDIAGTGTGTDRTGAKTRLFFDTDIRFMSGKFIGLDGKQHQGTFGFL